MGEWCNLFFISESENICPNGGIWQNEKETPTAMSQQPLQLSSIQKIGDLLAIAWADGREDYLGLEEVRKACPCAACKGEPDVLGRGVLPEPPPGSAQLTGWQMIGGYGWQPRWGDGHATGIFSYSYLRQLGEKAEK